MKRLMLSSAPQGRSEIELRHVIYANLTLKVKHLAGLKHVNDWQS